MARIPRAALKALRSGTIASEQDRRALLIMQPIYYNLIDHASSGESISSWSDTFTADHFADGTYTPFGGSNNTEGTDYTIGNGDLTILNQMDWFDPRATSVTIDTSITIAAIEDVSELLLGLQSTPSDTADTILAYLGTVGTAAVLVVGNSTQGDTVVSVLSDPLPSSGEVVLRLVCTTTEMTAYVNGTLAGTLPIPSQQQADLAAAPLHPFVEVIPGANVVVTSWSYEV